MPGDHFVIIWVCVAMLATVCVAMLATGATVATVGPANDGEGMTPSEILSTLSAEDQQLVQELMPGWEENWTQYTFKATHEKLSGDPPVNVEDEIHYFLWTRSNPDTKYILEKGNSSNIAASPLDVSRPTYFMFHGFLTNGENVWQLGAKDAYIDTRDSNVISVDYEALVTFPHIGTAVLNTYKIANSTSDFIDWLVTDFNLHLSTTTLVGHSLGAQIAGIVGNRISTGNVSRVMGLDPSIGFYFHQDDSLRINKDSGDFVDIIHTNSCPDPLVCAGIPYHLGDVDFYPNGGQHQPGCGNYFLDSIECCSHCRANDLWIESIRGGLFTSRPCTDWASYEAGLCSSCGDGCLIMGDQANITGLSERPTLGYFLTTNAEPPYAQG